MIVDRIFPLYSVNFINEWNLWRDGLWHLSRWNTSHIPSCCDMTLVWQSNCMHETYCANIKMQSFVHLDMLSTVWCHWHWYIILANTSLSQNALVVAVGYRIIFPLFSEIGDKIEIGMESIFNFDLDDDNLRLLYDLGGTCI